MSVTFRQATAADIPAIAELVPDLATYLGEADHFTSPVEQLGQDFQDGFFHAILAESNGAVAGMALYCFVYSTWKRRMIYPDDFVTS